MSDERAELAPVRVGACDPVTQTHARWTRERRQEVTQTQSGTNGASDAVTQTQEPMMTPLMMPARRPVTQTQAAVKVVYSTDTATARRDREIRAAHRDERAAEHVRAVQESCPGSNGEISSSSCRQVFGDRCCCW